MKVKKCKNLDEVRSNIDKLDEKIIKLISKRSGFVKEASRFKTSESGVKDPARVERVLEKIANLAVKYDMSPGIACEVYKTMIDCFVNMEMDEFRSS